MHDLREVYKNLLAGTISEADAARLDRELRQPPKGVASAAPRAVGRFPRMPYQRSPDRARSIERRKRLAATWAVPPHMAAHLTTSELAFCRLVADDFARHGSFDRCHDEAAARIGTCAKTIQRAQATLARLGWITVEVRPCKGAKHLPSVIRIVSPEWRQWIKNGPTPRPAPAKPPNHAKPIAGQKGPAPENHFDS